MQNIQRTSCPEYPEDPTREVYEAARSGNAESLSKVLQQMYSSQITSALRARKAYRLSFLCNELTDRLSPLIVAAENGNLDCMKVLLKYNADIESRLNDNPTILPRGYPPLHAATGNGHVDVLSCMVKNGADVNARLNDNFTPLMKVIMKGHLNAAIFLIEHGAKLDIQDRLRGYTAVHRAIFHANDSFDALSCLIKNGADINALANDNCTPLIIAILHGQLRTAVFLIEHEAKLDIRDALPTCGYTAIHHAVFHDSNSCAVLRCLIKNGADVNARTSYNQDRTPLMLAISNRDQNAAKCATEFLIKHGADVHIQDKIIIRCSTLPQGIPL